VNLVKFNPTKRFSTKAEKYVEYRPDYPSELIQYFNNTINLKGKCIADVGAGTGILTKLLLDNGNMVFAIEPNDNMRVNGMKFLHDYKGVTFVASNAERIQLRDECADVVMVAQAFHWFDASKAAKEFSRILKKDGYTILLWNELNNDEDGFNKEYQKLFNLYSEEYRTIKHEIELEVIENAFWPNKLEQIIFDNRQVLERSQFIGRLLSSSFSPNEADATYLNFLNDADLIFKKFQKDGFITIEYNTIVLICHMKTNL
jgi:ubiquinone/menaquinone biosynthesis C-methylase UbiE